MNSERPLKFFAAAINGPDSHRLFPDCGSTRGHQRKMPYFRPILCLNPGSMPGNFGWRTAAMDSDMLRKPANRP
ncbi:MAG: hypothetical protein V4720_02080, partial [Pseudomonadota bacterium]